MSIEMSRNLRFHPGDGYMIHILNKNLNMFYYRKVCGYLNNIVFLTCIAYTCYPPRFQGFTRINLKA